MQPKSTRIGRWHQQIMISVRLLAAVAQPVWRVHRIPTNSPASQQLAAQACHRLPFCRLCLCLGCHGLGGAPARLPPHSAVAAGQEGPQPVWAGLDQRQGKTHHSTCCRCLARGNTHHPLCCRCLARGGLLDLQFCNRVGCCTVILGYVPYLHLEAHQTDLHAQLAPGSLSGGHAAGRRTAHWHKLTSMGRVGGSTLWFGEGLRSFTGCFMCTDSKLCMQQLHIFTVLCLCGVCGMRRL